MINSNLKWKKGEYQNACVGGNARAAGSVNVNIGLWQDPFAKVVDGSDRRSAGEIRRRDGLDVHCRMR